MGGSYFLDILANCYEGLGDIGGALEIDKISNGMDMGVSTVFSKELMKNFLEGQRGKRLPSLDDMLEEFIRVTESLIGRGVSQRFAEQVIRGAERSRTSEELLQYITNLAFGGNIGGTGGHSEAWLRRKRYAAGPIKILNAFSASMLPDDLMEGRRAHTVTFQPMNINEIKQILTHAGYESYIGHENTADILSSLFGVEIKANRQSIKLDVGDVAIVAQYSGPRLPEGATVLPEGSDIKFFLIEIK